MWRCACEAVGRLCGHDATAALLSVLDRGVCMASWVRNRGDAAATDEAVKGLRWRRDRLLCRTPVLHLPPTEILTVPGQATGGEASTRAGGRGIPTEPRQWNQKSGGGPERQGLNLEDQVQAPCDASGSYHRSGGELNPAPRHEDRGRKLLGKCMGRDWPPRERVA